MMKTAGWISSPIVRFTGVNRAPVRRTCLPLRSALEDSGCSALADSGCSARPSPARLVPRPLGKRKAQLAQSPRARSLSELVALPAERSLIVTLLVIATLAIGLSTGCANSGFACGDGTLEQDGRCVPSPSLCPDGQVYAEGDCVNPCAPGTVLDAEGVCIPARDLCPGGQVWDNGECIDATDCGEGTVEDENGDCVPQADLCPDGQAWSDGECTDEGCSAGFANVDGICVPTDELCLPGEIWVDGTCRDERGCGAGTIELDGECLPIDPLADADLSEAAEPNDLWFASGAPTPFELPDTNDQSVLLAGAIGPAVDLDGDPATLEADVDSWVFEGDAGQRLRIEATAVGAPSMAVVLQRVDTADDIAFQRFALPLGTRNATREVVLPLAGTYEVAVGVATNLAERYGLIDDGSGLAHGDDNYTYLLAITPTASPSPIIATTGTFEVRGDLTDLLQWRLDLSPGTVVDLAVDAVNADVDARYWTAPPDFGEFFGERREGRHVIPDSGQLLLTVDYLYAAAADTGFGIYSFAHPTTAIDIESDLSTPVMLAQQVIDAGGSMFYGFSTDRDVVLDVSVDDTAGDAFVTVRLYDGQMEELEATAGVQTPDFSVALKAGRYVLEVDETQLPNTPGVFTFDLALAASPIETVGEGVLDLSVLSITELGIDTLREIDAEAFYQFDLTAVGVLAVIATPGSALDVGLQLFGDPLLAVGDSYQALFDQNGGGTGSVEIVQTGFLATPQTYIVRVENEFVDAPTGELGQLELEAILGLPQEGTFVGEVESNDTFGLANDLGALDTDATDGFAPALGYGDLGVTSGSSIQEGLTRDIWRFELDEPSAVVVETDQLGERALARAALEDTILAVYDDSGGLIALNDNVDDGACSGGDDDSCYSSLALNLPAGTYYTYVDTSGTSLLSPEQVPGGAYVITAQVDGVFELCAPGDVVCEGGVLQICFASGASYDAGLTCGLGCNEAGDGCESIVEVEGRFGNDDAATAVDLNEGGGKNETIDEGRTTVEGAIETRFQGRDQDWYAFTLPTLSRVTIETVQRGDSAFDTELWLYGTNPTPPPELVELENDDDGGDGTFSLLGPMMAEPGDYMIRVAYPTLADEPRSGPYELVIDVDNMSIPRVTSVSYPVIAHGGVLTISGENFTDVSSVAISGVLVANYTIDSDTRIQIADLDESIDVGADLPLVVSSPDGDSESVEVTVIHLVINEIDSDASDEFVEIATGVTDEIDLSGYVLAFFNGNETSGATARTYYRLDLGDGDATTDSMTGLLLVGEANLSPDIELTTALQNGEDAVAIYQRPLSVFGTGSNGPTIVEIGDTGLIDGVAYETGSDPDSTDLYLVDTSDDLTPVVDEDSNGPSGSRSIQRCTDDDARRDYRAFRTGSPTPGAVNSVSCD